MSSIVDFVLNFTDNGLAAVSTRANEVLNAIERGATATRKTIAGMAIVLAGLTLSVASVSAEMGNMGKATEKAGDKVSLLHRTLGKLKDFSAKSVNWVDNAADKSMNWLGKQSLNLGKKGLAWAGGQAVELGQKGLAAAGSVFMDSLDMGMKGQQEKAKFETIAGKEKGGKLYEDLGNFGSNSVLGDAVNGSALKMLNAGFNADDIMTDIKVLGDMSGGDKSSFANLALAEASVKKDGVLKADSLAKFSDAGFNPLEAISQQTGRGLTELTKAMNEGKVTFDMVHQSMVQSTQTGGRFHNALADAAATPGGRVEVYKNKIQDAQGQFGAAMMPAISKLLDAFQPLIDQLPAIVDALIPLGTQFVNFIAELLPGLIGFGEVIMTLLKPIFEAAFGDGMKLLMHGIIDIATQIGVTLAPAFKVLGVITSILAAAIGAALEIVSIIWEKLNNGVASLWHSITGDDKKPANKQPAPPSYEEVHKLMVDGKIPGIAGAGAQAPQSNVHQYAVDTGRKQLTAATPAGTKPEKAKREMANTSTQMGSAINGGDKRIYISISKIL